MKKLWLYALSICSVLLVGCNNGDDGLLDVPEGWAHKAVSLAVTPKTADIPMGLTQQLEADAVLETGQTVRVTTDSHLTWTSSDAAIATVDAAGLVTGVTKGTVTITAEGINNDGSRVSDTATITVTDAIAVDLTVTPRTKLIAQGLTQQYKAEALMSDGNVIDVTANANLTWSSSDTAIATISNGSDKGLATGVAKGITDIKAEGTVGSVTLSDTVKLTVSDATITDFVVSPATSSVPVGFEQPFTAEVVLSDNTIQDVTEQSTWTTSDPGTALVSDTAGTKGIAQGRAVSATPADIKAVFTLGSNTYTDSGKLTVTDETVTAFEVMPATASVPVNLTQAFIAKATLNTGRVMDVTEASTTSWTTSDGAIASIDNGSHKGLATGESAGSVTVTATATIAGTVHQDDAALSVTNATVTGIQVTPANETTAVGLSKPFTAIAQLSDGNTRDITADPATNWSTDNHDIATISNTAGFNGIAKGEAPGDVTVTASYNSGTTPMAGTAHLTVTDATITAIQVEPAVASTPVGLSKSFTATAILSDNTTQDITTDPYLSWTSSDSAIATISNGSNKGEALGEQVGTVTITAAFEIGGGLERGTATLHVTDAIVTKLQVTPKAETTIKGLSKSFTAIATLSDNSTVDVTNNAALSWSSSDTSIADITTGLSTGSGVATGINLGRVTIKAYGTNNGQTFEDTATLDVIAADVVRIEVAPKTATTPIGLTQSFTATAVLSNNDIIDITNDVALSWDSSDPTIATIASNQASGNGVATGVNVGTTTIKAQGTVNGTLFSDTATLNVTDAVITALEVTPVTATTPIGLTQQFIAKAILSDGITTINVTNEPAINWSIDDTSIATIDTDGLATGVLKGTVTVKASGTTPEGTDVEGTATLNVTDAVITSLQVTPPSESTPIGLTQGFIATAYFSDGTGSQDVTNDPAISWNTSDRNIATIESSNASGGNGVATGVALGSVTVTASGTTPEGTYLEGTASLAVTDAIAMGLQITPADETTPVGLSKPFEARALMSDGSSPVVTEDVDWSVSEPLIASINNTAGSKGEATGLNIGDTTITAQGVIGGESVSGMATLHVINAIAQSMEVKPATASIANGLTQQFIAEITLSDGTTVNDVTLDPATSWVSSTSVATIDGDGLATGQEVGTTDITASGTYDGIMLQDTATLTVTPATISSIEVTPASSTVPAGRTQQFTAIATMTDGTTPDITDDPDTTWQSSDTSIATITSSQASGNGLATGVTSNPTAQTITATNSGMSGMAQLTVTDAELLSIEVEPTAVEVAVGDTATLTAWGTYSDTATPADRRDITADVGWTGQDTTYATVSGGTVTGVAEGTTETQATLDGIVSNLVPITVTPPPVLVAITIDPRVIELSDRTPEMPLTATGYYDDGSDKDITGDVSWVVSQASLVNNSGSEERVDRIEMEANVVRPIGPDTATYRYIYEEAAVVAELDGVQSLPATVLQCMSAYGDPGYGTCYMEYDHELIVGSKTYTMYSAVAYSAYSYDAPWYYPTTKGTDADTGATYPELPDVRGNLDEACRDVLGPKYGTSAMDARGPGIDDLVDLNGIAVTRNYGPFRYMPGSAGEFEYVYNLVSEDSAAPHLPDGRLADGWAVSPGASTITLAPRYTFAGGASAICVME